MRGAPGCLGLGHNVALLVLWLRGAVLPPCVWAFWRLAVGGWHDCRRGSFPYIIFTY